MDSYYIRKNNSKKMCNKPAIVEGYYSLMSKTNDFTKKKSKEIVKMDEYY